MSTESLALPLVGDSKPDSALKIRRNTRDNLAIERWTEALSPRERPSISKTDIDPYVRKAVRSLQALKGSLEEWGDKQKWGERQERGRVETATTIATTTTSDYHLRPTSVRINDRTYSELSIEGIQTGTVLEKIGRANKQSLSNGLSILSSTLNLVAKLEHSRQDTLKTLQEQEEVTQELQREITKYDEERLIILSEHVQAEHEKCARSIREFKWYINFEGRKLHRELEYERILTKRNEELKQEVKKLTDINPLLTEKIEFEAGKIRDTTRLRHETLDDLDSIKHDLLELQDKCYQLQLVADAEKIKTEERIEEMTGTVNKANDELDSLVKSSSKERDKVNTAKKKLLSLSVRSQELIHQFGRTEKERCRLDSQVEKMDYDKKNIEYRKASVQKKLKEIKNVAAGECVLLEKVHQEKALAMKLDEGVLSRARREKEELEHSIDTIKETIVAANYKLADDEGSIARAYKELDRLDKQLEVSIVEYNHACKIHRRAVQEMKVEKTKAASEEDSLNESVDIIRKKIMEERKTKILYENKTKAQTAAMTTLMVEYEKQEECTLKVVSELEEQVKEKITKSKDIQDVHDEKVELLKSIQSELVDVQEELADVETTLGTRKEDLTSRLQLLKVEMVEKMSDVETTTENIKDLETKIGEKEKAIAMLDKLQSKTAEAIGQLTEEMGQLEEKLSIELEKEQSWKEEFKEIADFSKDAETKHSQYLVDRHDLLQKYRVGFSKSITDNTELALCYHQSQCDFIAIKTQALKVIEKKLKLETSLRDHQQLLAFQSCMYSSLQDRYQARGTQSVTYLGHCQMMSKKNMQQLDTVRDQLEGMLALMLVFLNKSAE